MPHPPVDTVLGDDRARHLVQFYGDDNLHLIHNVGRYLADGLARGEGGIAIATEAHLAGFRAEIGAAGIDLAAALSDGRLVLLDAQHTLAGLSPDGYPDPALFDRAIGGLVGDVLDRCPAGLRAYGEMVGLLWTAARFNAAIALEELWNGLLRERAFRLFCSYPIDVWSAEFSEAEVSGVLCTHSHLVPTEPKLRDALERAMDAVLGPPAASLRTLAADCGSPSWASLPTAEATILWLRRNMPEYSETILARARAYAAAA